MGLFDNYNEIEQMLLDIYSRNFSTMGIPNAERMAKDLLNQAIEESKKGGSYNLPPNFGDIILQREKAEQSVIEKVAEIFRKNLPQKKAEGVRNEDIEWWWNLNDVERNMMFKVDEMHRMALFMELIQGGMSPEKAGKEVWKAHPIYTYGDPNQKPEKAPPGLKREEYPLPAELKDRVNIYIEKRTKDDPDEVKKEIEKSSTFNAFVRKQIKKGNL